jgi:hypothetical protein
MRLRSVIALHGPAGYGRLAGMMIARSTTGTRSVWTLPSRAVRRCILIGQFIGCGEARSALVSPPR